jgi:hypothetical protein
MDMEYLPPATLRIRHTTERPGLVEASLFRLAVTLHYKLLTVWNPQWVFTCGSIKYQYLNAVLGVDILPAADETILLPPMKWLH